jgi:hypothetical protein
LEVVRQKVQCLGLEVVEQRKIICSTTTAEFVLPKKLFSVEEVLKELHAVVMELKVSGLDKTEVIRLRGIIEGCTVYKEMLADYMDYRGLEDKLMKVKYAVLSKKTLDASTKPAAWRIICFVA